MAAGTMLPRVIFRSSPPGLREWAETLVPPCGGGSRCGHGLERRKISGAAFWRDVKLVYSPKPRMVWAFLFSGGT
jgi:hypothetical protein